MDWYIRNYQRVHFALCGLTVAACAALLFGLYETESVPQGIFALMLLHLLIGGRLTRRAANRGITELYRDCDPVPLLENCDRLLAGAEDGDRSSLVLGLRGNRVAALMALGRLEEAEAELNRVQTLLPAKTDVVKVVACHDRIALNLRKGKFSGMEQEIEAVRAMLAKARVPSMFFGMSFPVLMELCLEHDACLLLLNTAGPIPVLGRRIRNLVEQAPAPMYQAQFIMLLAEYYLARGETGRAEEPLRFVAEHAPAMEIGAQAARRLERLGVGQPDPNTDR